MTAPLRFTLTFEAPARYLAGVRLDLIAESIRFGDEPGNRVTVADLVEEFGGAGVTVTLQRGDESVSWVMPG